MRGWWWWSWLVEEMTGAGGRCHRRKRKMMGRGAEGGCGTEEKPCPVSRVPTKFPAEGPASASEERTLVGLDFYTQARKALSERSPFDTEDAQVSSTVLTLPSGFANCLSRHSDGRKRQRKAHSGVEAKSSGAGGTEKAHKLNIWAETEDYFRELSVNDINTLHVLSFLDFSAMHKHLSIPLFPNGIADVNANANGDGSGGGVVVKEEAKEEDMEIDSVGVDVTLQEEKGCSTSSQPETSRSGLEWLLGSRSKTHLTSERPSKKRKLLGGDAGLEKLLVACPVDGLSSLCHFCSLGDTGDQLNRLIICSSCNVAVHQRCYGVQEDVEEGCSWLCSWCKQSNAVQSSDRPCLLCPRQGGALKPTSKRGVESENNGSVEFAHLFCCQWMPEVYIQDTRIMEPVMNIEGIKETRRKLICYLCKVKCGACVRCSNGTCRTSFHPICAREARHRMEIWGKLGSDDGDCLVPDLRSKIVAWLRKHAFIGTLKKNLKVKIKSSFASKDETGAADGSDAVVVSESDIPDVVPVKSVPPRRRTKNNIRILNDNKVSCSSKEMISDDGIVVDEAKRGELISEDAAYTSKESGFDVTEKNLDHDRVHDSVANNSPRREGGQEQRDTVTEQNVTPNVAPVCSVVMNDIPDLIKAEAVSSSYIHPLIRNEMTKLQDVVLSNNATYECDGLKDQGISPVEASSSSGICCYQHVEHLDSCDMICEFDGGKLEQLAKARNMDVLEMSPEDEVEGEIIFHQHWLLCNVVARKHISDDIICKVVKGLPQEIDAIGKQKWDAVLVNQYLSELREAKKRGRKERRHKEAQAVLAAATAAAASSLRISSFRKDTPDESAHQENQLKVNPSAGRAGLCSQQMPPRAKETLSKFAIPRISSETKSDFGQSISDFSKEHPRTCDICRRSESILNPILVCSSCKVAVHLDCYRSVKDSTGPWHCELCENLLSSRSSGAPALNSWEKPYFAVECGLCGGSAGAFRKSTDGQWIHAFCAEWVLESTFRRGQVNPVEGMESVLKGSEVCYICHRKQGVCIKCNYGHCQSTFHPSCARSAGCYMNIKTGGSKLQHKAYCERHSLEQRAKADTQSHGIEELKGLKKIRVELERLRLLCERITKREKLKRELVYCSNEVLVSNRDSVAFSALVRSPLFLPEVSSESATTSLKGNTDDCRSGSETIQRSDDVTIDSTVSGKRRIKFPVSMDSDQRTDDSSTSQHLFMQKPRERVSFAGKQIPHRPSVVASENLSDDGEKRSKWRKHTETFEKELIMTSDQASVKNQRLPKGFVYVPVGRLSKEKESNPDPYSGKRLERDG